MTVYDGRFRLGTVREHDHREFEAIDLQDRSLGRFKTMWEAAAALPDRPAPPATTRSDHGRFHGLDRG